MNMQALKNLQRKHWLMIIGGVTAVVMAFIVWAMAGSLKKLGDDPGVPAFLRSSGGSTSIFAQIQARQSSIAEQNATAAKYDARKQVLDGMRADIEAARKRLPTEAQKAEMRQLIEDLGRRVDGTTPLVVRSVAIRETTQSGPARKTASEYKTVEYMTSVSADMDGLIQFINLIERNERFMTIDGIQITSGGVVVAKESGKVQAKPHTVQLRILTYIDTTGRLPAGGGK